MSLSVYVKDLAPDLLPTAPPPAPEWWKQDPRTDGHAVHCLPLVMANTLGFLIRSPGRFRVTWDGDWDSYALVEPLSDDEFTVDNHSARATFTVQPGFTARTQQVGDFLYVKALPNLRGAWFTAMEAMIEAWWQPGEFGIVCMLNRPGTYLVERGQPIAQMCVYRAEAGAATLEVHQGVPPETEAWRTRRSRPEYRKDLDYLRGFHPDGRREPTHVRSWQALREGLAR